MSSELYRAPSANLEEAGTVSADAERIRKEHLKHEAAVRSIGTLYFVGAAAVGLMSAGAMSAALRHDGGAVIGAVVVAALLGIAALQIWVGIHIRRLREWTKIPVGILSGIGLFGFPVGTIINGYVLYLFFSAKGQVVLSSDYRQIIEATPHIKYRTSPILIGALILIVGFMVLAAVAGVMAD